MNVSAAALTNLQLVMERTAGRSEVVIGLIDGPVAVEHPDLLSSRRRELAASGNGACRQRDSMACLHGTFVAGVLCAKRGSAAPALCPDCTLLIRPIFSEAASDDVSMPSANPEALAVAIFECVEAGARILNLSLGLAQPSTKDERSLQEALDLAARRGTIMVAAAGNQGILGSTVVTRHPGVIPVAACDMRGRPTRNSNLGASIGRRGLSAPGEKITSLGTGGAPLTLDGTSAATPFVTGAIALLWSEFPAASARQVKFAVSRASSGRRRSVAPPLLDAWGAYLAMRTN